MQMALLQPITFLVKYCAGHAAAQVTAPETASAINKGALVEH